MQGAGGSDQPNYTLLYYRLLGLPERGNSALHAEIRAALLDYRRAKADYSVELANIIYADQSLAVQPRFNESLSQAVLASINQV